MTTSGRVLVTGATGFVGAALVARLVRDAVPVRGAVRRLPASGRSDAEFVEVGNLCSQTDWGVSLRAVDVVVHCAARVHVVHERACDPAVAFRQVNVDATLNLARQAANAGVRRFVFVSSIAVNGAETFGRAFRPDDPPAPSTLYGRSKLEAERGLMELAAALGLELVIVRPPLVYGPAAKATFATLVRWLQRGVPLPFGAIHNQRSLVGLHNLVDFLIVGARHAHARGRVWLVSDGEDLSTTELLRRVGEALGRPARLFSVPEAWLRTGARALGRAGLSQRLCGSLQVDSGETRRVLDWSPPVSMEAGLRDAAQWFLQNPGRQTSG